VLAKTLFIVLLLLSRLSPNLWFTWFIRTNRVTTISFCMRFWHCSRSILKNYTTVFVFWEVLFFWQIWLCWDCWLYLCENCGQQFFSGSRWYQVIHPCCLLLDSISNIQYLHWPWMPTAINFLSASKHRCRIWTWKQTHL